MAREGEAGDGGIDWAAVFDTERPRLRRLAVRLVGESHADDVVQETFLRAYRARSSFVSGSAPYPWLSTITRRITIDTLRRNELAARVEGELMGACQAASVDDAFTNGIRRQAIKQALSSLNERHRRLLLETELGGASGVSQVGSHAAVKSVLARARRNFRERYQAIAGENGVFAGSGASASVARRVRDVAMKWRVLAERAELAVAGIAVVTTLLASGVVVRGVSPVPTADTRVPTPETGAVNHVAAHTGEASPTSVRPPEVHASAALAIPGDGSGESSGGLHAGDADIGWEAESDGRMGRVHVRVDAATRRTWLDIDIACATNDASNLACTGVDALAPYVPKDREVGETWEGTGASASAELPQ